MLVLASTLLMYASLSRCHLLHARSPLLLRRTAVRMASSVPDISAMTVPQLKEQLRQRGLPVSGVKAALVTRLTPEFKLLKTRATPKLAKAKTSATTTKLSKRVSSGVTSVAAGKTVVVVESPAKCATISKFLGPNFVVLACYGHVRALPSKQGSVLPAQNFAMTFEDSIQPKARSLQPHVVETATPCSRGFNFVPFKPQTHAVEAAAPRLQVLNSYLTWQVLNPLRKAMRGTGGVEASRLLLATDPDREGEAIAWHVLELLQAHGSLPATCAVQRISFSEITKKAVDDALAAPRDLDMPLVRAQQARPETKHRNRALTLTSTLALTLALSLTVSRRGRRWTTWWASRYRPCYGASCLAAAPLAACSRWRCAWWRIARGKSRPSRRRSTGA